MKIIFKYVGSAKGLLPALQSEISREEGMRAEESENFYVDEKNRIGIK